MGTKSNENINLFYYGIKGYIYQFIGIFLIFIALCSMVFNFIFAIIIGILGGWLIMRGKAIRFDYQKQSGQIIHKGDGWK